MNGHSVLYFDMNFRLRNVVWNLWKFRFLSAQGGITIVFVVHLSSIEVHIRDGISDW